MTFRVDEIRARTFVRHVELHDELDSTNNRSIQLAHEPDLELPALIVARLQTAGRGRGNNKWWSADGALTFSLLLDPATHHIAVAGWPQLSLATAGALCDSILPHIPQRAEASPTPSGPSLGIKWPNDIYIDNRKIAGILLESPGGAAPAKDRLIIGIGINVNNSFRHVPPNVATNGIALCDVADRQFDLQLLVISILSALASRMEQLSTSDPQLVKTWNQLNLLVGNKITVENNGQFVEGRCAEIAADGALILDTPNGLRRFYCGSIRQYSPRSDPVG